jgi:outer membrane lipoprotein-sorting protein
MKKVVSFLIMLLVVGLACGGCGNKVAKKLEEKKNERQEDKKKNEESNALKGTNTALSPEIPIAVGAKGTQDEFLELSKDNRGIVFSNFKINDVDKSSEYDVTCSEQTMHVKQEISTTRFIIKAGTAYTIGVETTSNNNGYVFLSIVTYNSNTRNKSYTEFSNIENANKFRPTKKFTITIPHVTKYKGKVTFT